MARHLPPLGVRGIAGSGAMPLQVVCGNVCSANPRCSELRPVTDAVTEGRLQSLVDHYQGQVATYASVWQAMLGQQVKESGLYFTSSGQYVTV